jgi:hypothetical protein
VTLYISYLVLPYPTRFPLRLDRFILIHTKIRWVSGLHETSPFGGPTWIAVISSYNLLHLILASPFESLKTSFVRCRKWMSEVDVIASEAPSATQVLNLIL